MKLSELTNLYMEAKHRLEETKPVKKQKAVQGLPFMHEVVRDLGLISFVFAAIFLLIAVVPPPLHPSYDVTKPPTFVKPDWYLLWSLGPIFLAKYPITIGGTELVDTKLLGTILVNVAFVALMVIPFIAGRGKTKRPVESPLNAAMGVFGLSAIFWLTVVAISDVIFAYELKPSYGSLHFMVETQFVQDPSKLIDVIGLLTLHQSFLLAFLTYWLLKRHRPKYESKLNANYYKVR